MKLPWDKNYLKIAFHVVVTLIAVYVLFLVVNFVAYVITDFDTIMTGLSGILRAIIRVFSVVIIAFVISYLFDPLVDYFQKHYVTFRDKRLIPFRNKHIVPFKKNRLEKNKLYARLTRKRTKKEKTRNYTRRTAGVLITYIIVLLTLFTILSFVFYKIGSGAKNASLDDFVAMIRKTADDLSELYVSIRTRLLELEIGDFLSDLANSLVNGVANITKWLSANLPSLITSAGGVITNISMGMIVAFYFLRDKERYLEKVNLFTDNVLSKSASKKLRNFLSDAHAVFSGYVRGQLTDALIMGTLISVALTVIGVNFSVIIGIIAGLAQIIPYFGAFIAFFISVAIALLSGSPFKALLAGIVIIVLQYIDGMFIVPKIVGKRVDLSPAMVIISLSIGGALFGLVGMIFAVPVFAIINILLSRFLERRIAKKNASALAEAEMEDAE